MNEHSVIFSWTEPSLSAVTLTARREIGAPPRYAFNLSAHLWMAIDIASGSVYPNWTIAESDLHRLAEGVRHVASLLPEEHRPTQAHPYGIVVTGVDYSAADLVDEALTVAMGFWLADELSVERPSVRWDWSDDRQQRVPRIDADDEKR